jgi:hypothetical protein
VEQTAGGKAEADVHCAAQLAESVDHVFPQSKPPKTSLANSVTLDCLCSGAVPQSGRAPLRRPVAQRAPADCARRAHGHGRSNHRLPHPQR